MFKKYFYDSRIEKNGTDHRYRFSQLKTTHKKQCEICGREYFYGYEWQRLCDDCRGHNERLNSYSACEYTSKQI